MSASVRRNLKRIWLLVVAASSAPRSCPSEAHADPPGRLVYEIVVYAPGTKSRVDGDAVQPSGNPIATPPVHAGDDAARGVRQRHLNLFQPSGMIRTDMAESIKPTTPTKSWT